MPQIVAAVVSVVANVLMAVGVAKGIAVTISTIVVNLAVQAGVAAVQRALQPKPRGMQQGVVLQTKVDPTYPREVAVGVFATGGSLSFENVSGDENKYLWRVIVLSDAEIEEITQVRGNGEALTFSGDIHTGLRACTSHFQGGDGSDRLYLRIYKGTSTQTADADLLAAFPSLLDSNFRGRGVAYAIVRMEWSEYAWQSGSDLVFIGKGAKCYDPRTDTTVWTDNAALIAGQYLRGFENNGINVVGLGCDDADLPDDEIEAAADECDESVSLLAGGTEARYRAGGMISSRESPREVLADLTTAMGGAHVDQGGQIRLMPGVTRTAVLDFAEDDLLADAGVVYAGRRTSDDRVNAIVSTFVNPDEGFQESPLPPRKDASAITADGRRYETNRAYRFVYSKTQGQRLDEIELRRARLEGYLGFSAPLWAFELGPGDWITATNKRWGDTEKTWEVQSVDLAIVSGKAGGAPQARCAITAREVASSVYSWSTSDEISGAGAAITQPAPLTPFFDDTGRLTTVDALPLGALGGTALARSVAAPLSSSSSSQIDVAAHDVEFVGRTYELPSASITGLSTDTIYFVFWDIAADDYVETTSNTTATTYYTDPSNYIPVGTQRTQTGGGGYTPPPPPPPGGGGGYGGGGGGGYMIP